MGRGRTGFMRSAICSIGVKWQKCLNVRMHGSLITLDGYMVQHYLYNVNMF